MCERSLCISFRVVFLRRYLSDFPSLIFINHPLGLCLPSNFQLSSAHWEVIGICLQCDVLHVRTTVSGLLLKMHLPITVLASWLRCFPTFPIFQQITKITTALSISIKHMNANETASTLIRESIDHSVLKAQFLFSSFIFKQ